MSTQLLYLENMHDLEVDAQVIRVEQQDDRTVVYLEQTILYPQGGGQPYDTGTIESQGGEFIVEEVRFVDGDVLHIGRFRKGDFAQGEAVHITVDANRRRLNARLHSAGHLVDMAVNNLDVDWLPSKGYHFPDNPYVEYDGEFEPEDRDKVLAEIERLGNEYITQDLAVDCRFVQHDELKQLCRHVPPNIPVNKPTRIVQFGNFAVPCGGTHVRTLAEVESFVVTKLKKKSGKIRIGYNVGR